MGCVMHVAIKSALTACCQHSGLQPRAAALMLP